MKDKVLFRIMTDVESCTDIANNYFEVIFFKFNLTVQIRQGLVYYEIFKVTFLNLFNVCVFKQYIYKYIYMNERNV